MDWKEALKDRVFKRQAKLNTAFDNLVKVIESGRIDRDPNGETERQWLESIAEGGKTGINLCCGNFSIGGSIGVDLNRKFLGTDIVMNIDDVYTFGQDSLDYVVTNHIESTVNPSRLFFDIHSILKSGGVLAMSFVDTDYSEHDPLLDDVLMSGKKASLFNKTIMKYHLRKAGFKHVDVFSGCAPQFLRALAFK